MLRLKQILTPMTQELCADSGGGANLVASPRPTFPQDTQAVIATLAQVVIIF
jgi:hypothetical protein